MDSNHRSVTQQIYSLPPLTAREISHFTAALTDKLNALGPRQALNRGYAILLDGKTAVTQVEQAADEMTVLLQDGVLTVKTLDKRKEDPFGEEASFL